MLIYSCRIFYGLRLILLLLCAEESATRVASWSLESLFSTTDYHGSGMLASTEMATLQNSHVPWSELESLVSFRKEMQEKHAKLRLLFEGARQIHEDPSSPSELLVYIDHLYQDAAKVSKLPKPKWSGAQGHPELKKNGGAVLKRFLMIMEEVPQAMTPFSRILPSMQEEFDQYKLSHEPKSIPQWQELFDQSLVAQCAEVETILKQLPGTFGANHSAAVLTAHLVRPMELVMKSEFGPLVSDVKSGYDQLKLQYEELQSQLATAQENRQPNGAIRKLLINMLSSNLLPVNLQLLALVREAPQHKLPFQLDQHLKQGGAELDLFHQKFQSKLQSLEDDIRAHELVLILARAEEMERNQTRANAAIAAEAKRKALPAFRADALDLSRVRKSMESEYDLLETEFLEHYTRLGEMRLFQSWREQLEQDREYSHLLYDYVPKVRQALEANEKVHMILRIGLSEISHIAGKLLAEFQLEQKLYQQEFCRFFEDLVLLLAKRTSQIKRQITDYGHDLQEQHLLIEKYLLDGADQRLPEAHARYDTLKAEALELNHEYDDLKAKLQGMITLPLAKNAFVAQSLAWPPVSLEKLLKSDEEEWKRIHSELANLHNKPQSTMNDGSWLSWKGSITKLLGIARSSERTIEEATGYSTDPVRITPAVPFSYLAKQSCRIL